MESTRATAARANVATLDHVERAISATAPDGKGEVATKEAIVETPGISAEKLSATDVSWLYRAMIVALIGTMGIALIAMSLTILDGNDKTNPDLLLTVFTGALGGLVGLFARAPSQ